MRKAHFVARGRVCGSTGVSLIIKTPALTAYRDVGDLNVVAFMLYRCVFLICVFVTLPRSVHFYSDVHTRTERYARSWEYGV